MPLTSSVNQILQHLRTTKLCINSVNVGSVEQHCVHQLLGAWGLTALRRLRRVFKLGSGSGFSLGLTAVGLAGLGIGNGAGVFGLSLAADRVSAPIDLS